MQLFASSPTLGVANLLLVDFIICLWACANPQRISHTDWKFNIQTSAGHLRNLGIYNIFSWNRQKSSQQNQALTSAGRHVSDAFTSNPIVLWLPWITVSCQTLTWILAYTSQNKLPSLHCKIILGFFDWPHVSMMYIFGSMIFCDQIPWNSFSGDCWWYPCHGSHLIAECATQCCVGIFALSVSQKVLGDPIDNITCMFFWGVNEKGRSILSKTRWVWVETEYLAHSLPILPSSAGA